MEKIIDDYLASFAMDLNEFMVSKERLKLVNIADELVDCFREGGKLITMGNGGSSADAMHLAAEFVGRFSSDLSRYPLPAIALGTDPCITTALSNDFGYQHIFSKQLESILCEPDVLIAITTSGLSKNIIHGLKYNRMVNKKRTPNIALSGHSKTELDELCDIVVHVPSRITSHIQEIHGICCHILVTIVENIMFRQDKTSTKELNNG